MKKFCIALAMIACLFVSQHSVSAQVKGNVLYCIMIGQEPESYNSAHIWFDANGTFITDDLTPLTGVWYDNRGSRVWIYDDAPHSFYAGKKTMGYMRNDDTAWGGLPGLWYTKGTKKSNCEFAWMPTASFQASEGGLLQIHQNKNTLISEHITPRLDFFYPTLHNTKANGYYTKTIQ